MKYTRVDTADLPDIVDINDLFRVASTIERPTLMLKHFGAWFNRGRPADLVISAARRDMPGNRFKVTRLMTQSMRGDPNDPMTANPWRDWDSLPVYEGGFIGGIIDEGSPQLLRDLDATDDPDFGEHFAGMRSMTAIPQYHEGRATNWMLSFYRDPDGAEPEDLFEAMLRTSLLGMATRNLVSKRQEERLNNELNRQFEQIAAIQRSLLPQKTPSIPGFKIATAYLTSDHAGGDYYDFFPFPDGSWGILIADVSGHGPAAATVMAMLRAILHCYQGDDYSPARVMRYANEKLFASNLDGSFVTAFFAVYDPEASTLAWARCGHNPPLLKTPGPHDKGGGIRELDGTGVPPLGVLPDLEPEEESITIHPGETLILYTDGITESFAADRTMFGVDGIIASLNLCDGEPDCVVDSIFSALYKHTGSMDRDDDQTLVALRRTDDGSDGEPSA